MDEYIKKDDVLKLLNRNSITKIITFADGISVYDSVKKLPTADVVPRAEVLRDVNEIFIEELIDALEVERQSELQCRDSALECEECFEAEIHNYCEDKLDTIITSLQIFKAELKKKYTEDVKDDTSVEASGEAF